LVTSDDFLHYASDIRHLSDATRNYRWPFELFDPQLKYGENLTILVYGLNIQLYTRCAVKRSSDREPVRISDIGVGILQAGCCCFCYELELELQLYTLTTSPVEQTLVTPWGKGFIKLTAGSAIAVLIVLVSATVVIYRFLLGAYMRNMLVTLPASIFRVMLSVCIDRHLKTSTR